MRFKCDLCDKRIRKNEGYLLTTKQVTTSVECWKQNLKRLPERDIYTIANSTVAQSRALALRASVDTVWIVCEKCSAMFLFDRVDASAKAREFKATGKRSQGLRLCEVEKRNEGVIVIVDVVDREAFEKARQALKQALAEIVDEELPASVSDKLHRHPGKSEDREHLSALKLGADNFTENVSTCIVILINRRVERETALVRKLLERAEISDQARSNVFVNIVPDPTNKEKLATRIIMQAEVMGDRIGTKLDSRKTEVRDFDTIDPDTGAQIVGCIMYFYSAK